MSLEPTLTDITVKLRQGKFPNEQSISQGIVLRVLHELGWDIYDPAAVWPEYQTGEPESARGRGVRAATRADCCKRQEHLVGLGFALCHPPTKPAEFIEVKPPGKAEDGVRQALKPSVSETPRRRRARRANAVRQYAFHTGVPFIVLTDGRTWSFYLPAEQGSYDDRRVYKLDLYERPPTEAADILRRHLAHDRVVSGEALEAARKSRVRRDAAVVCGKYRSRTRCTQTERSTSGARCHGSRFRGDRSPAIPEAWRELVEKPSPRDAAAPFLPQRNEDLVDMLASAVESKAGVRSHVGRVVDTGMRVGAGCDPTNRKVTGKSRKIIANVMR